MPDPCELLIMNFVMVTIRVILGLGLKGFPENIPDWSAWIISNNFNGFVNVLVNGNDI